MQTLKINTPFSEEDKKFNKEMIQRSLNKSESNNKNCFKNKHYDFINEILNEYRNKWGLIQ